MRKKTEKKKPAPAYWNDDEIVPTLFERKEFKSYCAEILAILKKEPMSIAEIHRKLGEAKNIRWTADALSWLSDKVDQTRMIPNGYFLRQNNPAVRPGNWNQTGVPSEEKYHRALPRGAADTGVGGVQARERK